MLTISEVADFAGVTVRAVRHYHQRGLLPEPPRDASGYRRYDADAVVALIRIRTLAEAGVPLARVAELLDAGTEQFDRALQELDAELRARQRRLAEHRARVRLLSGGEGLALPRGAVEYLDRLRELGVSEENVRIERDSWILIHARHPEKVPGWIEMKNRQLDRPLYRRVYVLFDQARFWDEEDPRLEEVADAMVELVREDIAEAEAMGQTDDPGLEPAVVELVDQMTFAASPSWRRVRRLVEERGWTGWSDIQPTG